MQVTLNDIAEKTGILYKTLWERANKEGWKVAGYILKNGHKTRVFNLADLPQDIQELFLGKRVIEKLERFEEDFEDEAYVGLRISELQYFAVKMRKLQEILLEMTGLFEKGVLNVGILDEEYRIRVIPETLLGLIEKYGLKIFQYAMDEKLRFWVWIEIKPDIKVYAICDHKEIEKFKSYMNESSNQNKKVIRRGK